MSLPLSPQARLLVQILEATPRAQSVEELRKAFEAAGEPPSLVVSAIAECTLRRKVRRVVTWVGTTSINYYALDPEGGH